MAPPDRKTEIKLGRTPANKVGRPTCERLAPSTYSIRGVEPGTRRVMVKAAERTGKTVGQYTNEIGRRFAQNQLTQTPLPTAPIDRQNQLD